MCNLIAKATLGQDAVCKNLQNDCTSDFLGLVPGFVGRSEARRSYGMRRSGSGPDRQVILLSACCAVTASLARLVTAYKRCQNWAQIRGIAGKMSKVSGLWIESGDYNSTPYMIDICYGI